MAKSGSLHDPTKSKDLKEIRDRHEYAKQQWADIRKEAGIDMQFVAGNPWDEDDLRDREDRPTVAPEEMSQYRNQVTNALRGNPRGMKFTPVGNGASQKTAEFYQGKAREIEYRSHAVEAYITCGAENVLQRSYGYWRVKLEYESPRSPNQQLVIEGFPDPDVVLLDPDAKRRTSEDMQYGFVLETMPRAEFKRKYPKAKVTNFGDYVSRYKDWVIGARDIQLAEYWSIETRKRKLHALVLTLEGSSQLPNKPIFAFDDEIPAIQKQAARGVRIVENRELRDVDYPTVMKRITNGLEILSEEQHPGKYIPIVSLYGPILYVREGGQVKKKILSMTRFGRDPWKCYCFACCQELEVLGMVPHGSVVAAAGQLAGFEDDWEDSLHRPKLVLSYNTRTPGMNPGEERLPPPTRMEYTQGEYLQAIEVVKEGYRRAIQAAMGSNFLPTQAQHINDKSGKALEHINDAATQGTYHFVDAYEDGIRHTGVIVEDLIDKVYDYTGDTGVMDGKQEAKSVRINDPQDAEAFSTRGDHLVTVSTAPSSDSEYEAVEKFLESLLGNLQAIAAISGPQAAAALLAHSIKMRNLGPMGDELSDMLLPEAYKTQDGKPPDPRLIAATHQIQQMQQELQKLGFVIQTKQVEGQAKFQIEKYKTDAKSASDAADREVDLAKAELSARVARIELFLEESALVGARHREAAAQTREHAHDAIERAKDRVHERATDHAEHQMAKDLADQGQAHALARGEQATAGTMATQQQAAELQPEPEAGV